MRVAGLACGGMWLLLYKYACDKKPINIRLFFQNIYPAVNTVNSAKSSTSFQISLTSHKGKYFTLPENNRGEGR
jgi:hypothetical protein